MSLPTVHSLRTSLAERRAAHERRQRLARELAAYSSPADRLELDLILGRHSEEDAAEIQALLNSQAAAATYRLSA